MGLLKVPEVFVEGRKVHTRNIIHSWRMENEKGSYNTSFRKFLFVMVLPDTTKMCVRGSLFWGLFWKPILLLHCSHLSDSGRYEVRY